VSCALRVGRVVLTESEFFVSYCECVFKMKTVYVNKIITSVNFIKI